MPKHSTIHDSFIRAIMADKTIAIAYFEAYLPPFVSEALNFETLTPLPDTYLSDTLNKTISDIVYTCRQKKGNASVKVCLLVEHKSYPDKNTTIQIGSYIFSALQQQLSNKEELSIVIPVLLYHGKGKWQYHKLSHLFKPIDSRWKQFIPDFSYIYNDLGAISNEAVEKLNNRFLAASLLALKNSFQKKWLELNALKMLFLAEDASQNLQKNFAVYLFGRSELKEEDIRKLLDFLSTNLKNNVMSTLDIFIEKGMEIGLKIGIENLEKKNYEVVKNLLAINKLTISEIAKTAAVTEAFVKYVQQTSN